MSTARAECVSAPTEMKSTPVSRDGADVGQIHAAAGFGLRAAFAFLNRQPQLDGVHVVEQDDVRSRLHRLLDLVQRVGFDFNLELADNLARARCTAAAMAFGLASRNAAR